MFDYLKNSKEINKTIATHSLSGLIPFAEDKSRTENFDVLLTFVPLIATR